MKRAGIAIGVLAVAATSAVALAGPKDFKEFLTGYEEVPAISTPGNGTFKAKISKDETQIAWELSYSDLEGTVTQAHIHFGQPAINGGITVFLCTNLGNGPAGTQACPAAPATISGTILAADVSPVIPATQAARDQGMGTGELDELIDAIRAGATYVNVHSTTRAGGEIRSQIDGKDHDHH